MNYETFTTLGLAVSVCPQQRAWPNPDVEFSTQGDTITARGLHWSRNHEAANWLRDHTAKTLADLAAIDANENLSAMGRKDKKKRLVAQANAAIQQSKALAQAKETSGRQLAKWQTEFEAHLIPTA